MALIGFNEMKMRITLKVFIKNCYNKNERHLNVLL